MTHDAMMRHTVVAGLLTLLERDNDLTKCCAAKALGTIGGWETVPGLTECLRHDPDPDVRMEAAAALGRLAVPEVTDALRDALHADPDGDVRIQACEALGQIGDATVCEALIAALNVDELLSLDSGNDIDFDAAWTIQHNALEILGNLGDARAVAPIISLMRDNTYDDLQDLGFGALANIDAATARDFLLQRLHAGSALTRRRAAKALASVQGPDVVPALITALRDKDPDVCIAAARSLAAKSDPAAVSALVQLVTHRREDVRRHAVPLVATLPGDDVTPHLLRLLHDRKSSVQQQAVQVVGERGEKSATPHLLELLNTQHNNADVLTDVVIALGKLREPEAIAPLCRLLTQNQPAPATRLRTVLALGELLRPTDVSPYPPTAADQPDPIHVLIEATSDPDESVCLAALLSLSNIGGAPASAVLIKALRGEPLRERQEDNVAAAQPAPSANTFPTSTLAALAMQYAPVPDVDRTARQRNIQHYAARVARNTHDASLVDALLHAAEAPDPALQREALLSLAALGDPRVLGIALARLTASSRELQLAAIEALAGLKSPEAVTPLRHTVREATDRFVAQRAIETLETLGDHQAVGCIVPRLSDPDRQVRRAALHAMAALGARDAIEAIRPLLFDNGGELRIEAATALQTLGDPALSSMLLDILTKPEREEYHWIAIEVLAEIYKTG